MEVNQLGEMMDITAPKAVQVQIRADGKVVWINVDGLCVLRCCQIEVLEVEDARDLAQLPVGCPHNNYGGVPRNSEPCTCEPGWGHNAATWERFQTARG